MQQRMSEEHRRVHSAAEGDADEVRLELNYALVNNRAINTKQSTLDTTTRQLHNSTT